MPSQRARREKGWGGSAAPQLLLRDGEAGLMRPLQEETTAGAPTTQLEVEAQEPDLRVRASQGRALSTARHAGNTARPAPAHCTGLRTRQGCLEGSGLK